MRRIKNLVLYLCLVLCLILLFVGKPGFYTARSSLYLWDLGHILLFILLSIALLKSVRILREQSFLVQLIIIFLFGLVFGIITELIQVEFDRTPDLRDLGRDILGALIGHAFTSNQRYTVAALVRRSVQVVLIVVTCLEFYPLVIALIDEAIAYAQFPVLSNFETPFEAGRWTNHSHLKTEDRIARNGSKSLRIGITTSKYSGLSLKYFPADWTGYNYFNFSVYNPDSDTLKITCRIHDKNHNNRYADRYNEVFRVIPGWNDYSVPIKKIINTPKERRMDLSNIKLVGLFTVKSPRKRYLYLDDIMLTR